MPLISCPDCKKQISDRVEACPFCGCPSKYFNMEKAEEKTQYQKKDIIENHLSAQENFPEEKIEFKFGKFAIMYPMAMKEYAKNYGNYYDIANEYYDKYEILYGKANSIVEVLTDLADSVEKDLNTIVDKAVETLYSHKILITSDEFQDKYKINFGESISSLYEQVDSVQQESSDLENSRELKKASRGRWQGGGFGLKGAVKGAATAGLLNMGSGLLYSIGGAIGKSIDDRYINSKMKKIYEDPQNKEKFLNSICSCVFDILYGIKQEFIVNGLLDEECFPNGDEISSLYETTIKYEKDHDKLFSNLLRCIAAEPDLEKYYLPILDDLFQKDNDLEQFLAFWNLQAVNHKLGNTYICQISDLLTDPFIHNRCCIAVEIQGEIESSDGGGISVDGRVIKGKVKRGQNLVFAKKIATPLTSACVTNIICEGETVDETKIGKIYVFNMALNNYEEIKNSTFLSDPESFETIESNLYAKYTEDGKEILWGFAEESKGYRNYIFSFVKEDNYISNRGIDFDSTLDDIQEQYGIITELEYAGEKDVVYSVGRKNDWDIANVLPVAKKYLHYKFGDEYAIRFYFDENDTLLVVAYLKNVAISTDAADNALPETAIKMHRNIMCANCGKMISNDVKFCNFCGEISPLYSVECPSCGKRVKIGTKFCNFCGGKIVEPETEC